MIPMYSTVDQLNVMSVKRYKYYVQYSGLNVVSVERCFNTIIIWHCSSQDYRKGTSTRGRREQNDRRGVGHVSQRCWAGRDGRAAAITQKCEEEQSRRR